MTSDFQLTILGSGTMPPTKERNPSGFLVKVGGKYILLDAGHGILRRLTDYGHSIQDPDILFVSHFHTDHFSDAFALVHSRWVEDNYNFRKHKGIKIIGPDGLKKRFKLWRKIFWVEPKEKYPLNFLEGPKKIKIGKINIETFAVHHVKWFKSVGIIIKYQGKKIIYTGDIGTNHDFRELIKICKNADLLITEASYEMPTPNHFTIGQVKELVEKSDVKKVLVVHIRPQHLKRVEEVCKDNPKFILGIDGKKISI